MNRLTRLATRAGASMVAAGVLGVATMIGAVLVGLAPPAQAAVLGTLTLEPTNGTLDANPALLGASTSTACPSGFGDQAVLMVGPVGGVSGNLNRIASVGGYDLAPFTLDAGRSILTALGAATLPGGDYRITIVCIGVTGPHPDVFETLIEVTGNNWEVKGGGGPVNTPTTIALSASPSGSAGVDEQVTLTAQVNPPAATGSVQFRNGEGNAARNIGAPAPVTGGQATTTVNGDVLGDGLHTLTAVFVPSGTGYGPSTSAPMPYEITDASVRTTTTLTVTPNGSAAVGAAVTLTATVTPPGAVGKVKFTYRNASTIGDPVDVAQGVASVQTSELPAGEYQLTARFEPTDPDAYEPSDSTPVTYRIGAPPTPTPTATPTRSPTPSASPTPTTSSTPSESPTPTTTTQDPTPGSTASTGGSLALTGSSIPTLVAGGSVLVGTGVGVLLLSRRRRTP